MDLLSDISDIFLSNIWCIEYYFCKSKHAHLSGYCPENIFFLIDKIRLITTELWPLVPALLSNSPLCAGYTPGR
jgi:hypothetical protein